jgi:hypothetical protein
MDLKTIAGKAHCHLTGSQCPAAPIRCLLQDRTGGSGKPVDDGAPAAHGINLPQNARPARACGGAFRHRWARRRHISQSLVTVSGLPAKVAAASRRYGSRGDAIGSLPSGVPKASPHCTIGSQASIDPPWKREEENTYANEEWQREQCRDRHQERDDAIIKSRADILEIQERKNIRISWAGLAVIFHDWLAHQGAPERPLYSSRRYLIARSAFVKTCGMR